MPYKNGKPGLEPLTPLASLDAEIRRYLHLPDPAVLHVLLGALAANMLEGPPVWLMLIGGPASGKTELLNSLLGVPKVFELASITNESAFLSATSVKERSRDATGGILRQVDKHGAVVLNDFTGSVLSRDRNLVQGVLNVFRECYSGRWTRSVGVDGGRELNWRGKVAFLAGGTGEVDRSHTASQALGERWVYYRIEHDSVTNHERARKGLMNVTAPAWRDSLRGLITGFYGALNLGFSDDGQCAARRELTPTEMSRLVAMGELAARCRSAVVRDWREHEVIGVRETEAGVRLALALGQLLIGMEAIGVAPAERWAHLGRIALDSMPRLRRIIINAAYAGNSHGATLNYLMDLTGTSETWLLKAVEDLQIHNILRPELWGRECIVHLTDQAEKDFTTLLLH